MPTNTSRASSHRPLAFQRTPPQLVDAESFLNEGRGRRLFPEKYASHIQFGDGTRESATARAAHHTSTSRAASAHVASRAARDPDAPLPSHVDPFMAHPRRSFASARRDRSRSVETDTVGHSPATRARRPRGPGTDFARRIEAEGFPEGAARRHHGDDVAARERLRAFYTVQHADGNPDDAMRTSKRMRGIEFGRDRTDVREPLNLFDAQGGDLQAMVPMTREDVPVAAPDRMRAAPSSQAPMRALMRSNNSDGEEDNSDDDDNDDDDVLSERMAQQARRVAYLQALLERETEKLLAMADTMERNGKAKQVGDADATGFDLRETAPPKPALAPPRPARRQQPWEVERHHAPPHSASPEVKEEVAGAVEIDVDAEESEEVSSNSSDDDHHRAARRQREYTMDDQPRPPPATQTAEQSSNSSTAPRIRVLARHQPPPRSPPAAAASSQPVVNDSPHWKARLIAEARKRDRGQPASPLVTAWQPPAHTPAEMPRATTMAALQSVPTWSVPFPSRAHAQPSTRQQPSILVDARTVPPPPRTGQRHATPVSARATMRGRSCEHSPRKRADSLSEAAAVSSLSATNVSVPRRTNVSVANSHTGHSLLEVLEQSSLAAASHRTGRVAVARPAETRHDDSVQSLRDVFEAATSRRDPRRNTRQ